MRAKPTPNSDNPELSLTSVDRFMAEISDEERPILEAYLALDPDDVQGHMAMLEEHGDSFSKMTTGVGKLVKEYGCSFDAMKQALLMRLEPEPEPAAVPTSSSQAPVSTPPISMPARSSRPSVDETGEFRVPSSLRPESSGSISDYVQQEIGGNRKKGGMAAIASQLPDLDDGNMVMHYATQYEEREDQTLFLQVVEDLRSLGVCEDTREAFQLALKEVGIGLEAEAIPPSNEGNEPEEVVEEEEIVEEPRSRDTVEFGVGVADFNERTAEIRREDKLIGAAKRAAVRTKLKGSAAPVQPVEQPVSQQPSAAPALTPERFVHILDESGQAMLRDYLETDTDDEVSMDVLRELYGKDAIDDIHEQVSKMGDSSLETRQELSRILAENEPEEADENEEVIESNSSVSQPISLVAAGIMNTEAMPNAETTDQEFVGSLTPQGRAIVRWFLEIGDGIRDGNVLDNWGLSRDQKRAYARLQLVIIDRLNASADASKQITSALNALEVAFSDSSAPSQASPWVEAEIPADPLGDFLEQFSLDELIAIQKEINSTSNEQGGAMMGVRTPGTELIKKSMMKEPGFEEWGMVVARVSTFIAAHAIPGEAEQVAPFPNGGQNHASPWVAEAKAKPEEQSVIELAQHAEDGDDFVERLTPNQREQLRVHLARVEQAIREQSQIYVPEQPHAQAMAQAFQSLARKLGLAPAAMRSLLLTQLNYLSPKVVIPGQPEELTLRRLPEAKSRTAKTVVGKYKKIQARQAKEAAAPKKADKKPFGQAILGRIIKRSDKPKSK